MSGAKAIANQQPQLLGVQVSTCLYNTAIPLIVGTRRTSGRVVWYGYFRNGASGKKGKGAKKGLVTYVANLDVLLGFGPCWNVQSAWNNSSLIGYGEVDSQLINPYSQMKTQVYAVTAASYVTNADGTYTYSDTVNTVTSGWTADFISCVSFTPTTPTTAVTNDYGDPLAPNTITETLTEQWLYNIYDNYAGSGAGAVAWRPGSWGLGQPFCNSGKCTFPIGVDHGGLAWTGTLLAPLAGNFTVYFGETKNNHRYPASYVNYQFEPELGSGNEYDGSLSSQQIIYPELSGLAGVNIDLGSSGTAPQIDVETTGLYALDRNGQANPADLILDVILSGNIFFTDPSNGEFTPLCFSHGLNFGGDPSHMNTANILTNQYPGTYAWPPAVSFPYVVPGRGLYQILKDPPLFNGGVWESGTAYPSGIILTPGYPSPVTTLANVGATSMPWYNSDANYPYVTMVGGITGTRVAVAAGDTIVITYLSGTINIPYTWIGDANGQPGTSGTGAYHGNNVQFPGHWLPPCNAYCCVGAFINSAGAVLGAPFLIGDGPVTQVAPATTSWLSMGQNTNYFQSGSPPGAGWTMQVVDYPHGTPVVTGFWTYLGGEAGVSTEPGTSAAWIPFTGTFSDGLTDVRNYCQANGIFMSCTLQDQQEASQILEEVCKIANCTPVWNGQTLDFYPLSEASAIGGGYLYTPRPGSQLLIPTFGLQHFVVDGTEAPVVIRQTGLQSVYNILDVNYSDRGSDSLGACGYASYQSNSVRISDTQHAQAYGPMNGSPLGFDDYLCDATAASKVGWPIIKRQRYMDPYLIEFKLPKSLGTLFDPMDTLVVTEPTLFGGYQPGGGNLSGPGSSPVRIRSIEEDAAGVWTLSCERFLYGASVPAAPSVTGSTPNVPALLNASAGSVNSPYFFEPTNPLATALGVSTLNGLGIAISSNNANYGGCQVYVSTDGGSSYQLIGALNGSSTMGVLTADYPSHTSPDNSNVLTVNLTESDGELQSWTTAQRNQLVPIALIDGGGTSSTSGYTLTVPYEVIAYQAVSLTSAYTYQFAAQVLRGQLGTVPADHPHTVSVPGSIYVDLANPNSVFKTTIPSGQILGNVLYFKFPTYNQYATGLQDLADCTAYPYTVSGATNPGAFASYSVVPSPCLTQGQTSLGSGNNDPTRVYFPNLVVNYSTGSVSYTASSSVAFSNPSGGTTVYVSIYDPTRAGGSPTVDVQSTNVHATTPGYVFLGQITSAAWSGSPGSGTGGAASGGTSGSQGTGGPQSLGSAGTYAITVNGVPIQ